MHPPFQNILLATEHSEFDSGAERIAIEMARRCRMPLAGVLPIASNPEYEAVAPQLAARADAEAAARLRELQAAADAAGVVFECTVRRGSELDQEIVQEARAQGSDLIVARRRGKRGFFAKLLVGEMVSRVVAHAPCSVLLVPRDCDLWSRKVLLALDPRSSPEAQQAPLQAAMGVAAECGLPLAVVCVLDAEADRQAAQTLLAHVAEQAQALALRTETRVLSGKPYEQIIAAADRTGADLIVMGRHGDTLSGRAWLGGTTQKVIGLAQRPVLVAIRKL